MPRLTLYGMLNWDNTLFDGVVLPPGMIKDYLIDYIISEAGDLYPYYQVPAKIKSLTTSWFSRKLDGFTRMYNALMQDYNPLENYDRQEKGFESPDITKVDTPNITRERNSETSGETHNNGLTDMAASGNDTVSGNESGTAEHKVSAFDASTYQPDNTDITSRQSSGHTDRTSQQQTTTSDNATSKGTGKDVETETGNRTNTTKGRTDHELRVHGNIGVTTSQDMLLQELDLRLYDLYETIGDLWIDDFIVTIY